MLGAMFFNHCSSHWPSAIRLSQLDTLIHLNTLPELNCQFLLDISIDIAEDGLTVLFVAHYGMCLEIRDGWFTHVVPRTPFGAHRPGCG